MKKLTLAFTLTISFASTTVVANGEKIYNQICASCHSSGFMNSPQIGDAVKWKPLIDEGQVVITAHGYVGVRAMPPKGGKADLSVSDFSKALNFMVNKSGGNWSTPDEKMFESIKKEIDARRNAIQKAN